jgi:small-conductance mechanosensitive channel
MKDLLPNPYLLAFGISLLAYILILGVKLALSTRLSKYIGHRGRKWDEIFVFTIEKTSHLFMLGLALYLGFTYIPHKKKILLYADRTMFVLFMWQVAIWSHHLMEKWISSAITKRTKRNRAAASSISLIQLTARMLLFSVIFLLTLSNLGIKVTTLIAGLGVGGIAVALALQKILGDLFASLSIVLDKPFMVGDFIIIDQYLGEVEKIGLKTTRIRSLSGEQIIFSNSDLLGARIRNYKRMQERRVPFTLSLELHTTSEKVEMAVEHIAAVIRSTDRVRFERCHFMRIAASIDIEAVYWVLSDDYNVYMDAHQSILFNIKNGFEKEGINFTFPTSTVHVMPTEIHMRSFSPLGEGNAKPVDSIISPSSSSHN